MSAQAIQLDLEQQNEQLTELDAMDRVRWAVTQFGAHTVLLASMQKTSSVLIHMLHELDLENEILFVDTGFHFHETLKIRDEFMRRYGSNIQTLYPALTPTQQEEKFELKLFNYLDGQPDCCRMRKEEPFVHHMRSNEHRLVMIGMLHSERGRRGALKPLQTDPRFGGYALHPIIDWSEEQVDAYLQKHRVPVHELHGRSYPSIGCQVCTTPVTSGEDPRAGRWRHLRENDSGPRYCGINFSDGGGI